MVAEEVEGKLKYGSHFRFAIGVGELVVNQAKIFHKLQLNWWGGLKKIINNFPLFMTLILDNY